MDMYEHDNHRELVAKTGTESRGRYQGILLSYVRGCPLIAVLIHVSEASTRDYHLEVGTIGHKAKHLLAYQFMLSTRWFLAGLHLSRM